jgi:hypothetical protein
MYSGWTNYETWNVKLWLDNEPGTYDLQQEMAEAAEKDASDLANALRDFVTENMPDLDASMYSDLLTAAIGEVNWHEMAEAIIEDIEE